MRVFGLRSDANPSAPFAEPGDSLGLKLVLIAAMTANYFLLHRGSLLCAALTTVAALVLCAIAIKVRLLGGDVYDPLAPWTLKRVRREDGAPIAQDWNEPNWFNATPAGVRRWYVRWACLPFLSIVVGRFGFYIGAKEYGFDSPEYLDYPGVVPQDVFVGSRALCLSIRFSGARG